MVKTEPQIYTLQNPSIPNKLMLGADVVAGDDWPRVRRKLIVIKPIT